MEQFYNSQYKNYSIGELCEISRGQIISQEEIKNNSGEYPVYSSQTVNNGELGRISRYRYDGEYITWTTDGSNAGTIFYRHGKFNITNVCGLLKVKSQNVITKYLYYILNFKAQFFVNREIGNHKLMNRAISKIRVQLPPLETQKKVVQILDSLYEEKETLIEQYQREIKKRTEQYEFYRDLLLSDRYLDKLSRNIEYIELVRAFSLKNGYTPEKKEKCFWENGSIPWFRMEDIRKNGHILSDAMQHVTDKAVRGALFPANSILVATTATLGEHALITVPHLANQQMKCAIRKPEYIHRIDPIFAYYYFYKLDRWSLKNQHISNFPTVNITQFKKFKFAIPPRNVQKKIISILEPLEKVCNKLQAELINEIGLREKEYNYYVQQFCRK